MRSLSPKSQIFSESGLGILSNIQGYLLLDPSPTHGLETPLAGRSFQADIQICHFRCVCFIMLMKSVAHHIAASDLSR